MTKVVDINQKVQQNRAKPLIKMSKEFDVLILKYLSSGTDTRDIAGVMADRLGELGRLYQGDKEDFLKAVANITRKRTYQKDNK
jgi:hypothetical protein